MILVFDTETTGLIENMTTRHTHQPEIIEFSGTRMTARGMITDTIDLLFKPHSPLPPEITKITRLTDADLANKPPFNGHIVRDYIEASEMVIAHNAAFDRDMVDLEIARLGMTKIAWPRIICTIEATIHFTGYRLSLSALHEYLFKEPFEGAHRARADVDALVRCVIELKKRGEL